MRRKQWFEPEVEIQHQEIIRARWRSARAAIALRPISNSKWIAKILEGSKHSVKPSWHSSSIVTRMHDRAPWKTEPLVVRQTWQRISMHRKESGVLRVGQDKVQIQNPSRLSGASWRERFRGRTRRWSTKSKWFVKQFGSDSRRFTSPPFLPWCGAAWSFASEPMADLPSTGSFNSTVGYC